MAMPAGFVERHLQDAEEATFFGVRVADMSIDELRAAFLWAVKKQEAQKQQHKRDLDCFSSLRRR